MSRAAAAPRKRVKAPGTRRGDLLDSAERLFLEKGVAATSVDEIVAGAQVAKGTFYLYFGSKEALLLALRERFIERFIERTRSAVGSCAPGDWRGRLRTWVRCMLEIMLDEMALHDVVFHEFLPVDRRSLADNVVINELVAFVEAGGRAGAWLAANPRVAAIALFGALHSVGDDAVVTGYAADREALVDGAAAFAERALGWRAAA